MKNGNQRYEMLLSSFSFRAWHEFVGHEGKSTVMAVSQCKRADAYPACSRTVLVPVAGQISSDNEQRAKQEARIVFDSWSQSVPARTRKWARLFSKLDFEEYRKSSVSTHAASGGPGVAGPVAKMFGASNAKELRNIMQDFMRDLTVEEREELRLLLQAEAIRRGLGKYSITARKKNFS